MTQTELVQVESANTASDIRPSEAQAARVDAEDASEQELYDNVPCTD